MIKIMLQALYCIFLLASTVEAAMPELRGVNLVTGDTVNQVSMVKQSRGTVVVFLSARCPCSNSHVALIKKMYSEFSDFTFVGIHANANESIEESRKYFKENAFQFPVLEDVKSALADHFKAFKTPHVFVVDNSGQVIYKGGITNSSVAADSDRNYLREALEDIRKGQAVRTPEGRTLGCAISRGKNEGFF
jgi:peroxiredoxin